VKNSFGGRLLKALGESDILFEEGQRDRHGLGPKDGERIGEVQDPFVLIESAGDDGRFEFHGLRFELGLGAGA
jgi:hypothetical protein